MIGGALVVVMVMGGLVLIVIVIVSRALYINKNIYHKLTEGHFRLQSPIYDGNWSMMARNPLQRYPLYDANQRHTTYY